MDDIQIIELYFARDEQAIKVTDDKYGKLCLSIAFNILSCWEDSEECVNDTYLAVWNKIPPTRPNCFKAFICKITRNLSLKKIESANAIKRTSEAILSLNEMEETIPDSAIPPEIGEEELGKLINAFLWSQKEDVRNVFIRKYWFFDSVNDISKRYSFSENKIKSMLFHTRNKLRDYLKKEGFEL